MLRDASRNVSFATQMILTVAVMLACAAPLVAQTPQPTPTAVPPAKSSDSTGRTRRPVRRQPVTAELDRTAFADAQARTLLGRAREARIAQDSALRAYDAKTYQRFSVGMSLRRLGRDRLLFRSENTARVRWARESGLWVEPTGQRTAFPMGKASVDMAAATPIPYFPGREALWMPASEMGVAQAEVNENEFLHPLATGAEAYYRFATGDSASIALPNGSIVRLRELRITARRPEWRAFVGSFWFDVDRGSLVRAAYRMAVEMDIWQMADEEHRNDLAALAERLAADTGEARRATQKELERERKEDVPTIVKGMFSPMRVNISAITVEYGLYEGRFWLPKLNVAEGQVLAGFVRVPAKFEESFRYNSVNGSDPVPPVPEPAGPADTTVRDDTLYFTEGNITLNAGIGRGRRPAADTSAAARTALHDSLLTRYTFRAESLQAASDSARAKGDTTGARYIADRAARRRALIRQLVRRHEGCATDSTYYAGSASRYNGALRLAIRMPCDTAKLSNSPDLPGSIYEPGEETFGATERDALVKALDFALQPAWSPRRPTLHTGLDLLRYNRIEGLSLGGSATSMLGRGYTAGAVARLGTGDWMPNGDLSLARSNGRATLRLGVFHRLGIANDDWGSPLSFGASLANLLYARDEGFYYRSWGAELSGEREAPGPFGGATLLWRVFAERQRTAGRDPNTQASLGNLIGDTRFGRNIDAASLTALGASGDVVRSFGVDPMAFRLHTRLRAEGAFTDWSDTTSGGPAYGRLMLDGTLARAVGRFALALTGAGGTSVGDLPPQRAFYVGGLQTVRGQFARPEGDGRVGDAFWFGRGELGIGQFVFARPTLFYDLGWAGRRENFAHPGLPMSGAGVGLSLLDGMVRFDVARGIRPERRWRVDLYLEARF